MGILGGASYSYYDKLLESATSQLNLEPNWAAILEICDTIRQKDVPAKYALGAMKKKIFDKNPHVCQFSLSVLEACMKNCGAIFHDESASKEFMGELRDLIKNGNDQIKNQVLGMIQTWNYAFRNKPSYKIFQDTYNLLKIEGHTFPEAKEADAMFSADSAPEWAEGEVCHVCRVKFSTFTRQHHCRCCGQVFCARCSSKSSIIPKFGIEREVRVCDPCYDQINPESADSPSKAKKTENENGLPSEYLNHPLSKEEQSKPKPESTDAKAQEEEELQLAMALSLSASEVEKQKTQSSRNWSSPGTSSSTQNASSAPPMEAATSSLYGNTVSPIASDNADSNPEMSRYLNRTYWEEKSQGQSLYPTAPVSVASEPSVYTEPAEDVEENATEAGPDSSVFISTIQNSLDVFVDRMQLVTSKGRHVAMDPTVQSLFQSLTAMHPQLIRLVEEEEEQKAKYKAMLEKVASIREARESLNDMRKQHSEKLRQQELEQEMLRRMQMEQKLELMRQQKQEYLEYQHQLQIQRQQELDIQQQFKIQQKQMVPPGYYPQGQYPVSQYEGIVNPIQMPPYATAAPQMEGNAGQYVSPQPQQLPRRQQPDMGYQNPAHAGYEPQTQVKPIQQEPSPPQHQYQQYQPQAIPQLNDPNIIGGRALENPLEQPVPPQYPGYPSSQSNQPPQTMDMRQVMNALPADHSQQQYQAPGGPVSNQPSYNNQINPAIQQVGPYSMQGNAQPQSQFISSSQGQQQPGPPPPPQQQQQIPPQQQQIPPQQQQMPLQQQQQMPPQQQQMPLQQQQQMPPQQQQQMPPQQQMPSQQQHQMPPQQQQQMPPQQQQQIQPPQPQQQMPPPQQQHIPQHQQQGNPQQMNPQGYPLQAVQPQIAQQQTSPQQVQQSYPPPQQQQPQNQFVSPQQHQADIPASSHLHDMQLISFD